MAITLLKPREYSLLLCSANMRTASASVRESRRDWKKPAKGDGKSFGQECGEQNQVWLKQRIRKHTERRGFVRFVDFTSKLQQPGDRYTNKPNLRALAAV